MMVGCTVVGNGMLERYIEVSEETCHQGDGDRSQSPDSTAR